MIAPTCNVTVTNKPIIYHAEPLVQSNYVKLTQLSNQDYEDEVELAVNRFNDKSEESRTFIINATSELNELNSQIPDAVTETTSNFIEEPETNYVMARLRQKNADDYLKKAEENHEKYKFNSAIKNSEYSIALSNEGTKLVSIEKSKIRDFKNWVNVFGIIVVILLLILIIRSMSRQK